jgi:hypothetical protein
MKKFISLAFLLLTTVAFAQKPKYVLYSIVRNGEVVGKVYIKEPTPKKVTVIKKVKSKPKIVKIPEYTLVPVPTPPTAFDTTSVLQQYYPKNIHTDVLVLPNNVGTVQITDTIAYNRLVGRNWNAEVTRHTVEKLVEVQRPAVTEWYMGPHITSNLTQEFQSFGLSFVRKSAKDFILQFQIGGNVHQGTLKPNAYFGIGGLFKLR